VGINSKRCGCGWLWSGPAAALLAGRETAGAKSRCGAYGPHCRGAIAAISPISEKPMPRCCPASSAALALRAKGRPASGSHQLFVKRALWRTRAQIMFLQQVAGHAHRSNEARH
jgi:hypothetical protein